MALKLNPAQYYTLFLATVFFLLIKVLNCNPVVSSGRGAQQFGGYRQHCNSTISCNSEGLLSCISNTCQCESPTNQIYCAEAKMCKSIVGGPCTLSSGSVKKVQCIENAHCASVSVDSTTNFTECRCNDGYIENVSGSCVPGIGSKCNYEPEDCNILAMVMCKNGRCACLDNLQIYDEESKRCVSPAGTACKYDSLQLGCVKNAICYPFYYWIPPRCLCKPGYYQTRDRRCAKEDGSPAMMMAASALMMKRDGSEDL